MRLTKVTHKNRIILIAVIACILIILALTALIVGLVIGLRKSSAVTQTTTPSPTNTPYSSTSTTESNSRLKLTLDASSGGHVDKIEVLASLGNGVLASASSDKTVKLWNASAQQSTSNLLFTLQGHEGKVSALVVCSKNLLASGSFDTSIKVWNVTNFSLLKSFDAAHRFFISSLVYVAMHNYLVSSSYDASIKVWNLGLLEIVYTFDAANGGHTDIVWQVVSLNNSTIRWVLIFDKCFLILKVYSNFV